MTDYVSAVLDELVPSFDDERGDWDRVVRAARARRRRWITPRRLVLVAAVVAAIAVPLVAVAASREWWFFRSGAAPVPVTEVNVIPTGSWDGTRWQVTAYGSLTDGICFSMIPDLGGPAGFGSAMACSPMQGVPRTPRSKPDAPYGVTYVSGAALEGFPPYVIGPVVEAANEVEIHLASGTVLRAPAFDVPDRLGAIRFYVTRLPEEPRARSGPIRKLVGRTQDGRVVACLVSPMPAEGVPLSACG
jgi:hypothetical protein